MPSSKNSTAVSSFQFETSRFTSSSVEKMRVWKSGEYNVSYSHFELFGVRLFLPPRRKFDRNDPFSMPKHGDGGDFFFSPEIEGFELHVRQTGETGVPAVATALISGGGP